MKAIIIESGQTSRFLDARESRPKSLDPIEVVGNNPHTILDWILHAFQVNNIEDIIYIGGYHIEKVIERFPSLKYRYYSLKNQTEGELIVLQSYLATLDKADDLIILRANTLVMPDVIQKLIQSQSVSRGLYQISDKLHPVGAFYFKNIFLGTILDSIQTLIKSKPLSNIDDLVEVLGKKSIEVKEYDFSDLAAPSTVQEAMARVIFKGKGKTLENLAPLITKAVVLEQIRFSILDWKNNKKSVLEKIKAFFLKGLVVVRSNANSEDGLHSSGAGKYLSILNIKVDDEASLSQAIESVIASYGPLNSEAYEKNEILIQPQISNVSASGVVLTRDPNSGAPYFIVSLDRESSLTNVVTSGSGKIENYFISWVDEYRTTEDIQLNRILQLANELIQLLHIDCLDIEFAIDLKGTIFLLQVRPLIIRDKFLELHDQDVFESLNQGFHFVETKMKPNPFLSGQLTVLGVMPDWNPAEIIGVTPKPLALSLYQTLIGDLNWAEARARIGYKDVTPTSLIFSLSGIPYVDVRASLNSFLPKNLSSEISEKWIDGCIKKLKSHRHLHDKIEFEIAITCLTPDWSNHSQRLSDAGLTKEEIDEFKICIRELTQSILANSELLKEQFRLLEKMALRRERLLSQPSIDVNGIASNIRVLVEDVSKYGLIPFSILARFAFISLAILKALSTRNIITKEIHHAFLKSIPTVASRFSLDQKAYAKKEKTLEEFLKLYGHLRPSSYDITAGNYSDKAEQYIRSETFESCEPENNKEVAKAILMKYSKEIQNEFEILGLNLEVESLIEFMIESIIAREEAKFEFMKNIDLILELTAELGSHFQLDRDELAFLPISEITRLSTDSIVSGTGARLQSQIRFNKKRWMLTKALRLPDLITKPQEVFSYQLEQWQSNFITGKRVIAHPVWLESDYELEQLNGSIVIIRSADPGYDWIFSYPIAGLITEYGGMASHMAIRAAEFGLPAAIGGGGLLLNRLKGARKIDLDCENYKIEVLA